MCQCIRSITSDLHGNPGVMPIVQMGKLRLREPKTSQLAELCCHQGASF